MTTSSSAALSSIRILLIDDDDFQIDFISDLLGQLGVQDIRSAAGGEAAIQMLSTRAQFPDLILCDIHMPGIDGFELMKLLGDRDFSGGVILMSGQGSRVLYSASLVAQLARLNFLGTIEKPLQKETLLPMLERIASGTPSDRPT